MKLTSLLLLPCFILLLAACGTARRGTPLYAPVSTSEPAIAKGAIVFDTYCHKCHPGGEAGLAPALNNKPAPGVAIRFQVRHGLGAMPAFKETVISDEQLDNLLAYIKALRKAKKETPS
ncbi:c-type cytochrome [Pontibacter liquoris]|uniref:c-type cytochrome n=1 Tax=Pontibacter liquoris TaxID=2905677 RepID=UPI001FA70833|nr:cytochrome c [Pontibacter liquoris]